MWRAVVTVDWTNRMSAPASTAIGERRLVLAGVSETAQATPSRLISSTRSPMRLSLMGDEYIFWRSGVASTWGASMMCWMTASGSS